MAPKPSRDLARRLDGMRRLDIIIRAQQCVAYGRVSSDKQREDQTIETQKLLLIKDITVRDDPNLPEADQRKLVAQFWDDGVTGTIPLEERPEGKRLVGLICGRANMHCDGSCGANAVVDVVWITKLDRLARRLKILIEIEAFFRAHGVALRCLEFNIDTSDRNGKLMFHILGVIAEWEIETIKERTDGGRRTKASEGKTVGGRPTLGLTIDDDGYFVVDETLMEVADGMRMRANEIVAAIFENIALHGSTAWQEAEKFNLTQRRVLGILHNKKYKGEGGIFSHGKYHKGVLIQRGTWLPSRRAIPQIVSPEVWDLAQTKLVDNRARSSRNRKHDYLLSQLLVCCEPVDFTPEKSGRPSTHDRLPGLCGRNMCGRIEHRKSGNSYVYYTCTRAGSDRAACTSNPLRGRAVEDAVWAIVAQAQRHPDQFIDETLRKVDHTKLIHDLRMELSGLIDHLSRLDGERHIVNRQEQKLQLTEFEADARREEIAQEEQPLLDHKAALEQQLQSVTIRETNLERAGIAAPDIIAQLEHIEALCASDDPAQVSVGRKRKAALIHATVQRIEVRMLPNGSHDLLMFLRFGGALPLSIDQRLGSETEVTQQPVVVAHRLILSRSAA